MIGRHAYALINISPNRELVGGEEGGGGGGAGRDTVSGDSVKLSTNTDHFSGYCQDS